MDLQDEIRKLVGSDTARHKRLIQYTVRQLRAGRDLDGVLEDPYIVNRVTPLERRALLDEPEVIAAAREDLLEQMRERLESLAGG